MESRPVRARFPRFGRFGRLAPLAVAAVIAAAVLVWRTAAVTPPAEGSAPAADFASAAAGAVAVVELFTSQGCSSCPPADRLLSELAADPRFADRVFPLSFHVDYWNRLGWRDPFSSARWSERQRQYADRLGASVYTPQVVVNGRTEGVGSRRTEVLGQIEHALSTRPAAEVDLVLEPGAAASGLVVTSVTARWSGGRPSDPTRPAAGEVWAVLWHDGRSTDVPSGENADRELVNDRVVRRLKRLGTLPAAGDSGGEGGGRVTFELEASWAIEDLGVLAFVQDPETLEILGAAAASVG